MRKLKMDIISEKEAKERDGFFMPDEGPAITMGNGEVVYVCGNCKKHLAEVQPNFRLVVVLKCPQCGSFNDSPH